MRAKAKGVSKDETLSLEGVKKLRVVDLRGELKKRGLDTSGLKAVLVKRLEEAIAASLKEEKREEEEEEKGGPPPPPPPAAANEESEEKEIEGDAPGADQAAAVDHEHAAAPVPPVVETKKREREESEKREDEREEYKNAAEEALEEEKVEEVNDEVFEERKAATSLVLANKRQRTKDSKSLMVRVDANGVRRLSSLDAPIMCCEGHASEVFTMKFSPDGSCFASGSMNKQIFLWNVRGECENFCVLKGHKNAVLDLHWTTDGSYVVSASPDKTVRVWDVEYGMQVKKWDEHQGIVNSCCPARRGNPLFVSGSDDGTAKIWDQRRKRSIHTCEDAYQVTSVGFSDQAEYIYTGGIENVIKVWDLRKLQVVETLRGHTDTITGLSLSNDGSFLLTNSMDNTLRVWDVRPYAPGGRCTGVLTGHRHNFEKNLLKCGWSPDDKHVTCGDSAGFVYLWDRHSGSLVYRLPGHQGSVNEAVFHPKENIIGSCSSDGKIFLGEVDV